MRRRLLRRRRPISGHCGHQRVAAAASASVLDVICAQDWDVTRVGASERLAQIARIPGSQQVVVADTQHFFEGTTS